ncbi:hypothetical protein [Nostoc sp. UHCC 0926]
MGFDVEWGIVSANHLGAIHKRERVWIIATNSQSITTEFFSTIL